MREIPSPAQTTKHAALAHPRSHKFSCHKIRRENNQRSLTLFTVKTPSSPIIIQFTSTFYRDFELKLSFDELTGGNRNYTQVGNSEINIEQQQPTSLLRSEEFNCISNFLQWPDPRPDQVRSHQPPDRISPVLQSSAKKLSGVFSFPPPRPGWSCAELSLEENPWNSKHLCKYFYIHEDLYSISLPEHSQKIFHSTFRTREHK